MLIGCKAEVDGSTCWPLTSSTPAGKSRADVAESPGIRAGRTSLAESQDAVTSQDARMSCMGIHRGAIDRDICSS